VNGNLERLLSKYTTDKKVIELINTIQSKPCPRIKLLGMIGSLDSLMLSAVYKLQPRSHLFIGYDKDDAAYFQNNMTNLLEKEVYLLPDSFKRPKKFEDLDNGNILQRTEIVNKIHGSKNKHEIVVTYPEALFEKIVSPKILERYRIDITKGEKVNVKTITEVLIEYDFKREEFIFEPGQFSIRGSIIDIFSYGNEWPYRIELFDEEVETIRTFDPMTQLSQQNISKINIIPNINTRFKNQEKVSIFSVLPTNTVIWIRNLQDFIDRIQNCFDEAFKFAESVSALDKSELAEIFRDRAFVKPMEIVTQIQQFPIICLFDPDSNTNNIFNISFDKEILMRVNPQPSFNKNFTLLINNLNNNTSNKIENYLFAENPKQIERFYSIFEDVNANIDFHPVPTALHQGFVDLDTKVACYTDHQIFDRFHRFKIKQGFSKDKSLNLKLLRELKSGDYVTHIDHGIGRYSGLEKININGHIQEAVRVFYKNNDILYVSIHSLHKIAKYIGKDGTEPKLDKIGSDAWNNLKRKTKAKLKDIAGELIKLYAARKSAKGITYPPDGYLQNELEASFIYEDTPDQFKATQDVKEDMMKAYPMDRLICGDVGFGKTEVAIRAAFKAVSDGKQVAVLVPTTILALQHHQTFSKRLDDFSIKVDYVNRFRTAKEKTEIYQKLKTGEIEIIIGTHAILSKAIGFKDLGLLIIDEEQKFGVAAKEKLRSLKVNVDTLTLTATPIPRTLQFSLMAARDLSIIRTPPPNRQPIHTEVRVLNEELIKESIYYEINRGGQVFFVHNRVKSLPDVAEMIRRLCPDVNVSMAHGQMESDSLETTLLGFIDKESDVLVCTNIIETGLDIANANTIIINDAHQFGLSDLHQLRGRVGRSNKKAFCYLFCPPLSTLTPEAKKRLKTLEEFSDLGSGFDIAMRDLDIRGAGNLLGAEQSGFIADIGYEMYQKILEEAVTELKQNEYKDLFQEEFQKELTYVRDITLDSDVEMHLPDEYVSNVQERLNLYTQLDKLDSEQEIQNFQAMLKDRFGRLPKPVLELFEGLRLRWVCKSMGFERLILKNNKLRCYFVENPQSSFYESDIFQQLFQYIATKGGKLQLNIKKNNRHLIVAKDGVHSLKQARLLLTQIKEEALNLS